MSINLHLPSKTESLRPTITVIGVGGAGGNAVNNMIAAKLEGVNFVVANTDAQALEHALTQKRIQLGSGSTRGLGAGANPEVGETAANETMDEIAEAIEGSNMVFITAGMGGGTGTGAAPVVAKLAREQGILTVGVVTKPFHFEGANRMRLADAGLQELQQYVDTLIVIPNQNLFRIANEKTTFADAFRMADEVLHSGVRGLTDLIIKPGMVNLDFADIRTVMREMGKAMMGTGEASGDRRAIDAAEAAISNPLLDDVSLKGAKAVLINITGGTDMTLYEVDEAANRIREEVDPDANIIFGSAFNDTMEGKLRVSVVATGIDSGHTAQSQRPAGVSSLDMRKPYTILPTAPKQDAKTAIMKPQLIVQAPAVSKPVSTLQTGFEFSESAGYMDKPLHSFEAMAEQRTEARYDGRAELPEAATQPAPQAMPQPAAHPVPHATPNFAGPQFYAAPRGQDTGFAPAQPRPQPREEPSRGFFQKVAGFGKAMAKPYQETERVSPTEARSMQVSEKARGEMQTEKAPAASEEDYLDIPAFLRRQAN